MTKVTANDRLIFTLLLSIILYLAILLGVGFKVSSPLTNQPVTNIEITLVKQKTDAAPKEADFLAQVTNEGGGETEHKDPSPSQQLQTDSTVNQQSSSMPRPQPVIKPEKPVPLTVKKPEPVRPPAPQKPKVEHAKAPQIITQKKAERKVVKPVELAEKETKETVSSPPKPKISARDLIMNARGEIARLEQEYDAHAAALSKRPKKRRISASTKEYSAAAYMKSWEEKVERIGNYNYPEEAKRRGLNGSLMLSVDINPDGSVPPDGIVVSHSSGYKILDDAAVKIVRLGAPYAAIPKDVLGGNDMLTIIRTWKFEVGRGLSSH